MDEAIPLLRISKSALAANGGRQDFSSAIHTQRTVDPGNACCLTAVSAMNPPAGQSDGFQLAAAVENVGTRKDRSAGYQSTILNGSITSGSEGRPLTTPPE